MEFRLDEAQIPEIWEAEGEKELTDRELKDKCFRWALGHFRGKSFINKSINGAIAVSRDGLGEWKTVTKSRDQSISIKILDEMLESATFWKEEPPKNRNPNIEKVMYFRQDCRLNGNLYTAVITVKAYKALNYRKYYHHYLDDFDIGLKK